MDRNEFLDLITPGQRAELNALVRRLGGGSWEVDEDAVDVTDGGSAVEERLTTLLVRLNGRNGTLAHRWSVTALAQAVDPSILVAGGIRTLAEHVHRWEAEGLVELTAEQQERERAAEAFDTYVTTKLAAAIADYLHGERIADDDPDGDAHAVIVEADGAELVFNVAGVNYVATIRPQAAS